MKIDMTDREIELLMGCVGTNIETVKRRHDPADPMIAELIEELFELETDLREALHRQGDGWGIDAEINAETQMFNAGVDAREQVKATSRAADRRALKFSPLGSGAKADRSAPQPKERSDMQDHDVFADGWNPSDPSNW